MLNRERETGIGSGHLEAEESAEERDGSQERISSDPVEGASPEAVKASEFKGENPEEETRFESAKNFNRIYKEIDEIVEHEMDAFLSSLSKEDLDKVQLLFSTDMPSQYEGEMGMIRSKFRKSLARGDLSHSNLSHSKKERESMLRDFLENLEGRLYGEIDCVELFGTKDPEVAKQRNKELYAYTLSVNDKNMGDILRKIGQNIMRELKAN